MKVTSYDSFEEMQSALQVAEEAAAKRITPTQSKVTFGDCWAMPVPEFGCVVFGHVWRREDFERSWEENDVPQEERDDEMKMTEEMLERGFVFGRAYSVLEERGELGSTHKSDLWPITGQQFLEASEVEWRHRELPWLVDAFVEAALEVATFEQYDESLPFNRQGLQ